VGDLTCQPPSDAPERIPIDLTSAYAEIIEVDMLKHSGGSSAIDYPAALSLHSHNTTVSYSLYVRATTAVLRYGGDSQLDFKASITYV